MKPTANKPDALLQVVALLLLCSNMHLGNVKDVAGFLTDCADRRGPIPFPPLSEVVKITRAARRLIRQRRNHGAV